MTRYDAMNAFASQPPIIPNIPGILGFDHVGVAVADLNEGISFYQNVFGATLIHQEINSAQGVHEAMLSIGNTGNSTLQLLAPLTPESPIGKFLSKNGKFYLMSISIVYVFFPLLSHVLPGMSIDYTIKRAYFKLFPLMLFYFANCGTLLKLTIKLDNFMYKGKPNSI